MGYRYIDTGAMYRVIGVLAAERGIACTDTMQLAALCDATRIDFVERPNGLRTCADGRDLSEAIRTVDAAQLASKVSAVPTVRERLVAQQRALAAAGGVVMEGRDIGTVVCPDAAVKAFLDASVAARARRRAGELRQHPSAGDVARIEREIAERDARDRTRAHSPLRPATDAVIVDTTDKTIDEVVDLLRTLVARRTAVLASRT
ncbi:MAG: (d)CMP kinase [Candidatus Binatia bacterium]